MIPRGGIGGGLSLLAALACSSTSGSPDAARDAGSDRVVPADAPACTAPDVFCGGVCQPESVVACGASCKTCPQPASSHGLSDCQNGTCLSECAPGYDACGSQSCCGNMTRGDVVDIAVGGDTSCGVTTAGNVWCWGDDSYGALGDGNTGGQSSMPVQVVNLPSSVEHVVVGGHHTCALLSGGLVACWGDDQQGQLGDGQRQPRGTPVKPQGLMTAVTRIATGGSHTCAVQQGGALSCWGDNTYGQLGDPMAPSSSATPVPVAGLSSGVVDVAAGGAFTCALLAAGQVQCWGDGNNGQTGGTMSSPMPATVPMPSPVSAIVAGSRHACALTTAGGVVCWGADDVNQLGSGHAGSQPQPIAVPMLSGVKALAAGGDETCALDGAGAVHCWGADPVGDVAMGPAGPAVVPSLSSGVAGIGVMSGHACAITTDGAPKCWGDNTYGDLGDGSMVSSWAPIDVQGI